MASTRERIIEATLTLIAERGLSQVTMIQIARTADIARQTLYNHYPDIPAILTEALSHHDTEAIDHLDQALSAVDTPTDTIRQLVRHTLDGISTMVAAAPHDAPRIVADATRTLLASHRSESP